MGRTIALFASLLFVGLTAGGAFGVYLAYNPSGMSPAFYVETMQHGIRVMLPLAVVLNLGLLFTLVSTVLVRRDRPTFFLLIAASCCIIAGLLVTVLGNWPINNQLITWSINSPPGNWTELRDKWWQFHVVRAISIVAALGFLIAGALLRNRSKQELITGK